MDQGIQDKAAFSRLPKAMKTMGIEMISYYGMIVPHVVIHYRSFYRSGVYTMKTGHLNNKEGAQR